MDMEKKDYMEVASLSLVIIGALNWGLIGVSGLNPPSINLISVTLGSVSPLLENLVYMLVGLGGLYQFYFSYQLYGED
ncbi:MAG: DUF378 domain-containing protein [Candidatus Nanohaloarchaea archaeon]